MMRVVQDKISRAKLEDFAQKMYGEFVKAVVDVGLEIMAIGGELHADEEALLIEQGSKQENLWGINIYPDKPEDEWIEFDSIINLRPSMGNRSREVKDPKIREKIKKIVRKLIE